ncbi:MAG: Calx-beta domain-containing protein [Dolichospermum sp.]
MNNFWTLFDTAFGSGYNFATAASFRSQWQSQDFSQFPQIEIVSSEVLGSANGAYAISTNRIYLSDQFVSTASQQSLDAVILEEFGHFVDAQVNNSDSAGDEGDIFSALVLGKNLTESQLQQLKSEDDQATITLDGQVIIEIEQASVSDSGGPEGSNKKIKLESKGGGVAKFDYEHYFIPDKFIIVYEGQELLNTGFVGGSKSGEVQIPKGNSDVLEVRVVTNDQGTAWYYTVTTDTCPEPDPFVLELVGGEFEDTDDDGDCDGQGTIYIGRKDGISRMLRIEGRVEYTDKKISVDGTIFSLIGAGSVTTNPLFKGKFEIDVSSGTTSSFEETGNLANEYTLGGLDVDFSGLTINRNGLALGAKFKLLEEIGFPDYLFSGSDALLISQDNVAIGPSIKASFPTIKFEDFKFLGFIPIKEFSDFSIEFVAPEDKIKIQGKLTVDLSSKPRSGELVANLAGDNFLQIQGGKFDVVGELTAQTDLKFPPKGWGLKELKLNINTIEKNIEGGAKLILPIGRTVEVDGELGFKLPIPPLQLNKLSLSVDNLNIPIPQFPGVFFQGLRGAAENFAGSDPDIEFSGGVSATLGPQILGISAIRFDADGKLSEKQFSGTGKITVINDKLVQASGTSTLNWSEKFYETKGDFSILDGLIKTNNGFKVNSNFDINMSGQAIVSIPNSIKFFGGAQLGSGNFSLDFSNDGNLSNDFAAGWITFNIQKLGLEINAVIGFKGYFDGRVEKLSAKNTPKISSFARFERVDARNTPQISGFEIAPDTEWILMGADWENSVNGDVAVQVELPDGTIINEADFAANNIAVVEELSDSTSKVIVVFNPQPGIWNIKVVDETGLGEVSYTDLRNSFLPSIEITSPATDVSGGIVTINYNAFDADSNAEIALFYDTDNQGFDGIQIVDDLIENDGSGSFLWNTEGVATGEYFIYGMVIDENNPPALSYSSGQVRITEKADLSVTQTTNLSSVVAGNHFTYTVTVTNNGLADAKDVILVETLPEEATFFISATVTPSQQTGNTLTFDLGNLAKDASQTFAFIVTAPKTLGTITATATVSSKTFDPDATNDVAILTTSVEAIPAETSDLSVIRTDNEDSVNLGEQYIYTLTVTNNGPNDATEVVLTENLPSGVNFISQTVNQGFTSFNYSSQIQILTANFGTIKSGQTATLSITVNPFVAGDLISTTSVTSSKTDPNPINNELINTKVVNSIVPAAADLELIQSVNKLNPDIGEQVTFTLTLTNKGHGSATGIQVKDILPPSLSFISALPEQGIYNQNTGIWDVGNIKDNLSRTLRIIAQVNLSGSIINTAEIITVNEGDPDSVPNNNNPNEDDQASVTVNVNSSKISFSSPTFRVNENGDYIRAVTIIRTENVAGVDSVTVTPTNGTATAPGDFNSNPIIVNFANGETSKTIRIPIENDTAVESTETVNLTLSNPSRGATLGSRPTAVLTIVDNDGSFGHSVGDPHMKTLDGIYYEFQSVGFFTLLKSTTDDFEIQARQESWNGNSNVSVNTAIAIKIGGNRFQLDLSANPLKIDGIATNLPNGQYQLIGNNNIVRSNNTYTVISENGDQIQVALNGSYIDVFAYPASNRQGKLVGLLGNDHGNQNDEFAIRNGTVIGGTVD